MTKTISNSTKNDQTEPIHQISKNRRSTDKQESSVEFQKKQRILKAAVTSLCSLIIILQVLDAISTFIGLNTGHLVERNFLLNKISHTLNAPIQIVVIFAKMLVTFMFAWVMIKTKPTFNTVASLFFVAAFYIAVVHRNFYWFSLANALNT